LLVPWQLWRVRLWGCLLLQRWLRLATWQHLLQVVALLQLVFLLSQLHVSLIIFLQRAEQVLVFLLSQLHALLADSQLRWMQLSLLHLSRRIHLLHWLEQKVKH
jgi:hypothetical protein